MTNARLGNGVDIPTRRGGCCEHAGSRRADLPRYMGSTPFVRAQHAVHVEDQHGLFPSGIAEVPACAGKP
jgi:hypothetical protein